MSDWIKRVKIYILILFLIHVVSSIAYMIISKSSLHGIFSILYFLQMISLLIMFEVTLPRSIINLVESIQDYLLHLNFLSLGSFYIEYESCDIFTRKLSICSALKILGFKSRSSLNSTFHILMLILLLLVFQGVVLLINHFYKKNMKRVRMRG